jgi:hypothetical protein
VLYHLAAAQRTEHSGTSQSAPAFNFNQPKVIQNSEQKLYRVSPPCQGAAMSDLDIEARRGQHGNGATRWQRHRRQYTELGVLGFSGVIASHLLYRTIEHPIWKALSPKFAAGESAAKSIRSTIVVIPCGTWSAAKEHPIPIHDLSNVQYQQGC